MTGDHWLRTGLRIGRTEYRRTLRALREDPVQLTLVAMGGLFVAGGTLFVAWLAAIFGPQLRGTSLSISRSAGSEVVVFWGFYAFIEVSRVLSEDARIDAEDLVLPAAGPRAVLTGLVTAEWLRATSYFAVPVLVLGATLGVVVRAPLWSLAVVATATLFLLTVVLVAYAVALAAAVVVVRVPLVARYRTVFGLLGIVLVFAPYVYVTLGNRVPVLGWVPIAWYADLFVVGSPVEGSPYRAAGALACSVAIVLGGGAVAERLAIAYWYDDGTVSEADDGGPGGPDGVAAAARTPGLPVAPSRWLSRPTGAVARKTVALVRRNPGRFGFLLVPLFGLGPALVTTGDGGLGLSPSAPIVAAIVLPWLTGAAVGLNPLGDEGPVLPVTLVSTIDGRQYVRGLLVPAVGIGGVAVTAAVLAGGLLLAYPPAKLVATLALAWSLLSASSTLAPAVGIRLPRFSALAARGSTDVVPPSVTAMLVHGAVIGLLGATGWVYLATPSIPAAYVSLLTPVDVELSAFAIRWSGIAIVGAASIVVTVLAYRSSVRQFEGYHVD